MSSSVEAPGCSGRAVMCVPHEADGTWLFTKWSAPSWLQRGEIPGWRCSPAQETEILAGLGVFAPFPTTLLSVGALTVLL